MALATVQGMVFLTALARDLGVLEKTVREFAKRMRLGTPSPSGRIMLSQEAADMVRSFYAPPPWSALPVADAAKLLLVSSDAIERLVKIGKIAGHKQGIRLMVKEDDVLLEMVCRRILPPSACLVG